jgi:hypothetical protein
LILIGQGRWVVAVSSKYESTTKATLVILQAAAVLVYKTVHAAVTYKSCPPLDGSHKTAMWIKRTADSMVLDPGLARVLVDLRLKVCQSGVTFERSRPCLPFILVWRATA